jgi:hypothetical protein
VDTTTGFRCEAVTVGNTRIGMDVAAMTTGSPAITCGLRVAHATVGTLRRGALLDDSAEIVKGDGIVSGVTGTNGWIIRAGDDTTQFLRLRALYNGGVPILAIDSVGTTLPAT